VRLVIVNENVPGVLGAVTTMLGEAELNILQTVNTSRGDVRASCLPTLPALFCATVSGVLPMSYLYLPFSTY
jgi:hypothetical protein